MSIVSERPFASRKQRRAVIHTYFRPPSRLSYIIIITIIPIVITTCIIITNRKLLVLVLILTIKHLFFCSTAAIDTLDIDFMHLGNHAEITTAPVAIVMRPSHLISSRLVSSPFFASNSDRCLLHQDQTAIVFVLALIIAVGVPPFIDLCSVYGSR